MTKYAGALLQHSHRIMREQARARREATLRIEWESKLAQDWDAVVSAMTAPTLFDRWLFGSGLPAGDNGPAPQPPKDSELWDVLGSGNPDGPCGEIDYRHCGDMSPIEPRSSTIVPPTLDGLVLEGAWSDCETAFMANVWGFLRANIDIVQWSVCLVNPEEVDCVTDIILGNRESDQVLGFDNDDCTRYKGYRAPDGSIYFCRDYMDTGLWDRSVAIWCCGKSTQAAKDCAVISVAGALLHEILHRCNFDHPNLGEEWMGPCNETYLAGSYFGWAILQRYPDAAASNCCDVLRVSYAAPPQEADGLFPGTDQYLTWPRPDCDPLCGPNQPDWQPTPPDPPPDPPGPRYPGPFGGLPAPRPLDLFTVSDSDTTIILDGAVISW